MTSGVVKELIDKIFIRATLTEEELVFSRIDMPNTTIEELKNMPSTDIKSAISEINAKPHPNLSCPGMIYHVPVFKQ